MLCVGCTHDLSCTHIYRYIDTSFFSSFPIIWGRRNGIEYHSSIWCAQCVLLSISLFYMSLSNWFSLIFVTGAYWSSPTLVPDFISPDFISTLITSSSSHSPPVSFFGFSLSITSLTSHALNWILSSYDCLIECLWCIFDTNQEMTSWINRKHLLNTVRADASGVNIRGKNIADFTSADDTSTVAMENLQEISHWYTAVWKWD